MWSFLSRIIIRFFWSVLISNPDATHVCTIKGAEEEKSIVKMRIAGFPLPRARETHVPSGSGSDCARFLRNAKTSVLISNPDATHVCTIKGAEEEKSIVKMRIAGFPLPRARETHVPSGSGSDCARFLRNAKTSVLISNPDATHVCTIKGDEEEKSIVKMRIAGFPLPRARETHVPSGSGSDCARFLRNAKTSVLISNPDATHAGVSLYRHGMTVAGFEPATSGL